MVLFSKKIKKAKQQKQTKKTKHRETIIEPINI